MPFPLAHPAAVLPLRSYGSCRLDFPALIIGSLSPDFAYCLGRLHVAHLHVAQLSHRFLAGSFGFDLPVGLLVAVMFYQFRRMFFGILPTPYRDAIMRHWRRTVGPGLVIISLLIGAWTHILLDSMTHEDGWLVEHLPVLQGHVLGLQKDALTIHQVLYYACTFVGVTCVALSYLGWLESVPGLAVAGGPPAKWVWALVSAIAVLLVAAASRKPDPWVGLLPAGILTVLLVIGFVIVTPRPIAETGT
jgi:hypothetical protein